MNKMQAQRTPGPWASWEGNPWSITAPDQSNGKDDLYHVAMVQDSPRGIANAAFIVEACNSHDALTARVTELALSLIAFTYSYGPGNIARAALKGKA